MMKLNYTNYNPSRRIKEGGMKEQIVELGLNLSES